MGLRWAPGSVAVEADQELAGFDLAADGGQDVGHAAGPLGVDGCFHLHGFDREQFLALADRVADVDADADDEAGQGGGDLVGVGRVGLGGFADGGGERAVGDDDLAGLAVEFEEDGAFAVGVGLADVRNLTMRVLPGSISTGISVPCSGPKKNMGVGRTDGIGVGALVGGEVGEDAGVEDVAQGVLQRWRGRPRKAAAFSRAASRSAGGRLAPGRSVRAGRPLRTRVWISGGKPPGGWPRRPSKNSTTLSGKASSRSVSRTSSGVRLLATRKRAMSPTTFEEGVTLTISPKRRLTWA